MLFPRQLAKDRGGESADSLMEEGHQPIRRQPSRLYVTLVLSALCLKQFSRHAQDDR